MVASMLNAVDERTEHHEHAAGEDPAAEVPPRTIVSRLDPIRVVDVVDDVELVAALRPAGDDIGDHLAHYCVRVTHLGSVAIAGDDRGASERPGGEQVALGLPIALLPREQGGGDGDDPRQDTE
jgi:hypothetical protein